MTGRRVCPNCGAIYNLAFNRPKVEGDVRHGAARELIQRPDDMPDAIDTRLQLYFELTEPLLDYYGSRGLVTTIDGNQPIESFNEAIVDALAVSAGQSET